mgnify:CR=1 FL=1
MLTEERYAKIISIVERMGSVTVQQLMRELEASESTIRRDLNALDVSGQLTKVYGGAVSKGSVYSTRDEEMESRKGVHRDSKLRIARYAARLIMPGDFVYMHQYALICILFPKINPINVYFGLTVYILGI